MTQLITQLTLIFLVLAALVFAFQLIRQKRAGEPSVSSFSTLLLIVLIGWMATEVVHDASGVNRGEPLQLAHFLVMVLVASAVTLQLRRSFRE